MPHSYQDIKEIFQILHNIDSSIFAYCEETLTVPENERKNQKLEKEIVELSQSSGAKGVPENNQHAPNASQDSGSSQIQVIDLNPLVVLEPKVRNLCRVDLQQVVLSLVPIEQWKYIAQWLFLAQKKFKLPTRIVPASLCLLERGLLTSIKLVNTDILISVAASMVIATNIDPNCNVDVLNVSTYLGKDPSVIEDAIVEIMESCKWKCTVVTALDIIEIIEEKLFEDALTSPERNFRCSLFRSLFENIFTDWYLAHMRASSIAFAALTLFMALVDRHKRKKINIDDILELAQDSDVTFHEVRLCLQELVKTMNESVSKQHGKKSCHS